jgi:hypothetical protein
MFYPYMVVGSAKNEDEHIMSPYVIRNHSYDRILYSKIQCPFSIVALGIILNP